MRGYIRVMKFCECGVRCLCVQVLCRGGLCGCAWYLKSRLSIVKFVECVVWCPRLMWVVHVGGIVVL